MTRTRSSPTAAKAESSRARMRRSMRTAAALAAISAAAVTTALTPHLIKTPMYDSPRTGEMYIQELLQAHDHRIHGVLGVHKHVFRALVRELQECSGLSSTKHISQEEQLAIFLRLARSGLGQRDAQEMFQRAPDTVSMCVNC